MLSEKIKLLEKVEELRDILDKYKPFEAKHINGFFEWKLLLMADCITSGTKIKEDEEFLKQHAEAKIKNQVVSFWHKIRIARDDTDPYSDENLRLWHIEMFLFSIMQKMGD